MTATEPTEVAPPKAVPALEARNLTKHYSVRRGMFALRSAPLHALDDVSLTLETGGIVSVVGESGSGKSTLARVLSRLVPATSGELLLDGRHMPNNMRGRRAYSGIVQLVLQDPFASLNPVHSVRYHLERPLRIHGFEEPSIEDAMHSLLRRVALEPSDLYIDKYPHELSGGQRQRVAIARALAARPRVLIADEPVSMLDVSIRLGVLNLFADLRDRDRLAILYVTHDIASARYLADTIVVMYAGQIVEAGPAVTVTDTPSHPYTRLLLSAAPDPDRAEPAELEGHGAPPSLISPPNGCRFHPRCPYAMSVCREQSPPRVEVATGHASVCWLHVDQKPPE